MIRCIVRHIDEPLEVCMVMNTIPRKGENIVLVKAGAPYNNRLFVVERIVHYAYVGTSTSDVLLIVDGKDIIP